jgi:DNA-binding NarL/FixJ family response regulator
MLPPPTGVSAAGSGVAGGTDRTMERVGTEMHADDATAIRVVLVDDHCLVAEAMEAVVSATSDLQVVGTAADVTEAWDTVERERPDVVLVDHPLPSGDGITLASSMKRRFPDVHTLIVTGHCDDQVMTRAVAEGCDGVVNKSAHIEDMLAAIRNAFAGEPVYSTKDLTRAIRNMAAKRANPELSERELQVLRLMAAGATTEAISDQLLISVHTVRSHVRHILEKLGSHSKLEAVSKAVRDGLVTVDG